MIVTIDGVPHAAFVNRAAAEEAVKLWQGVVTGGGCPIRPGRPESSGWPAVRGRSLAIVER